MVYALALLLLIWPFSSGGKTYHMAVSNQVPAATATVQVQRNDTNPNTDLDIKVSHLAPASSLTPAESVYIAWVRPNGEAAVKKGAIRVDNDLNGELKIVTTSKNFDLFITAEHSENTTAPLGPEILHTHIKLGS